jgi:kumamolisin
MAVFGIEEAFVNNLVRLPRSRRHHRHGTTILGRTEPHEICDITLVIRRQKPIPEPAADGSPSVTIQELRTQHAPADGDLKQVRDVLARHGLTILAINKSGATIKASGPASAMENLFHTRLFQATNGTQVYRGRAGDLFVPKELDGVVTAVLGLDTRPMVHKKRQRRPYPINELPAAGSRSWFTPQELGLHYHFPAGDGTGQTLALLELGGSYSATDMQAFLDITAPATPTPNIITKYAQPLPPQVATDPDMIGEVMLDVEIAASLCPYATIVLYFANWSEQGWLDVLNAALDDPENQARLFSVSWGMAEGADIWTQAAMDAVNDSLKAFAALGYTVCVAAGDDGSDDQVGDGLAHVNFPASSPYVLAVGGTMIGAGHETAWKEGSGVRAQGGGATGGGVSQVFAVPEWQTIYAMPSVNPGAAAGRCLPDVAADAGASSGYFSVANGQPGVDGGTSAATPLWAALLCLTNEALAGNGSVGFLTPKLYQANANTGTAMLGMNACTDITAGNNISAAVGGYTAEPGYDLVTGWGVPYGQMLVQYLRLPTAQAKAPLTPAQVAPADRIPTPA